MPADEGAPRVRVRGIYATALTARLVGHDGLEIVDPSPPIARRFETAFDGATADATIRMTADRQGVGIAGKSSAVAHITSVLEAVDVDTFAWEEPAPRDAIFEGEVIETNRGGGVVALPGDRTGFLPFGDIDGYLDEGDRVQVQVHEAKPPWVDAEPRLGTEIRTGGEIASLVRGVDALVAGTPDGSHQHELARTTEMLSTTVPDEWGVNWEYTAEDAELGVLDGALEKAVDAARDIEEAIEDGPDSGGVVTKPTATTWVWFGRASRFTLDEDRASVTSTMTGHHRIKAGSEAASTAVDFVERLDHVDDSFPFEAVTDVFGPTAGSQVTISHGKPDGRCISLGEGTVHDRSIGKERITVKREMTSSGTYDAIGTEREPGDVAITRFAEGRWWYPTLYRGAEGESKGTYVNIATPIEIFPSTVRYVDLYIDVVRRPDGSVEIVDEAELEEAVEAGRLSERIAQRASEVAERVAAAFEAESEAE